MKILSLHFSSTLWGNQEGRQSIWQRSFAVRVHVTTNTAKRTERWRRIVLKGRWRRRNAARLGERQSVTYILIIQSASSRHSFKVSHFSDPGGVYVFSDKHVTTKKENVIFFILLIFQEFQIWRAEKHRWQKEKEVKNEGQKNTGLCPHQSHQSVYVSCFEKEEVLNANIINSHPVSEMTVIKSSLSRLHYANKFTFTAEGWNIPISTDQWAGRGGGSLDNSTTMKTSVILTFFEGFLTPGDRQTTS